MLSQTMTISKMMTYNNCQAHQLCQCLPRLRVWRCQTLPNLQSQRSRHLFQIPNLSCCLKLQPLVLRLHPSRQRLQSLHPSDHSGEASAQKPQPLSLESPAQQISQLLKKLSLRLSQQRSSVKDLEEPGLLDKRREVPHLGRCLVGLEQSLLSNQGWVRIHHKLSSQGLVRIQLKLRSQFLLDLRQMGLIPSMRMLLSLH
jgi:hypothetical protein